MRARQLSEASPCELLVAGQEAQAVVEREEQDAVARVPDIELRVARVQQEILRLVRAEAESEAQAEQRVAARTALARKDLVAVDEIQVAAAQRLGPVQSALFKRPLQQLRQLRRVQGRIVPLQISAQIGAAGKLLLQFGCRFRLHFILQRTIILSL